MRKHNAELFKEDLSNNLELPRDVEVRSVTLQNPRTSFVFNKAGIDKYSFIEDVTNYADMIVKGYTYGIKSPHYPDKYLGLGDGWIVVKESNHWIPYSPAEFNRKYRYC